MNVVSSAEFHSYFEHVRSLSFEDRPDYDYLKRLFRELFFRRGYAYDNVFDWNMLPAAGSAGVAPPPVFARPGEGNDMSDARLAPPEVPTAEEERELEMFLNEEVTQRGRVAGLEMPSRAMAADDGAQGVYRSTRSRTRE